MAKRGKTGRKAGKRGGHTLGMIHGRRQRMRVEIFGHSGILRMVFEVG